MPRLRVLLPALALVVTACSGDGDGAQNGIESPNPHALKTTTSAPGDTSSSSSSSSSSSETTASTATPGSTAAPGSSATSATTRPATTVTGPPATTATTLPPATTAQPVALSELRLQLTQVVNLGSGFGPIAMAQRAGDDTLYVAGQRGRVVAVRNGEADTTPVLDMSGEVTAGGEQGLLGIAFSPDGNLLYVSYTDRSEDSQLRELPFRDGRADFAAGRQILSLADRFANHNGGQVTFGPDGLLY
ncbi:MAG: PQQ-dependent sugar dehydrogenase, partial [Acidimicrobiia bacterium]